VVSRKTSRRTRTAPGGIRGRLVAGASGYAGVYRRPNGGEAAVLVDQDRLWWQSPAGRYLLTQVAPDRFVMKADNRIMAFVFDDKGNVTRTDVTYPGDSNTYALPRLR